MKQDEPSHGSTPWANIIGGGGLVLGAARAGFGWLTGRRTSLEHQVELALEQTKAAMQGLKEANERIDALEGHIDAMRSEAEQCQATVASLTVERNEANARATELGRQVGDRDQLVTLLRKESEESRATSKALNDFHVARIQQLEQQISDAASGASKNEGAPQP